MNDIDLVSRHSLFMSVITTKPQYVSDASSVSRKSLMSVEGDMFSSHEIRGRSQIMSAKFSGFLTPSPLVSIWIQ